MKKESEQRRRKNTLRASRRKNDQDRGRSTCTVTLGSGQNGPFARGRTITVTLGSGQNGPFARGRTIEDRHFQHQQHQQASAESHGVARKGTARRRLPPGAQGRAASTSG